MMIVTVSERFQVVIPRQVRESLGKRPGQKLEIRRLSGRIQLVPLQDIKSARGALDGIGTNVAREKDRV